MILYTFSLCCNDPANGMSLGYVDAAQLAGLSLEGRPIKIGYKRKKLNFGRLRMPIYGFINWHGNWCWDSVKIAPNDVVRVLAYMQRANWHAYEGVIELFGPFNDGIPIMLEMLQEALPA